MRTGLVLMAWFGCSLAGLACAEEANPAVTAPPEPTITASQRDHWAYRPLAKVSPPEVADVRIRGNPVDRFVRAAQEQRSVASLPAVSKATLLRRVTFDLTGLPPTTQEIVDFLQDTTPEAYEKVVERLLSSPAYGERWAQHWLDLARFAETDGFEHDLVRPNARRYRDWVIDALNRDVPFDEFIRLQLAGDEQAADRDAMVATGFLLCGPDMPDINLQEERRHEVLNEMTATVGSVFLGLQIGCAQCHDHKYDPLTQYDFYRLRAFFEPTDLFRDHPIPTAQEQSARDTAEAAWTPADRAGVKRRRELEDLGRKRFREKNPDERPSLEQVIAELSDAERQEHAALVERLRALPELPELPLGRVVRGAAERASYLYLRGDFRRPAITVTAGYPQVLRPAADAIENAGPLSEQQKPSRIQLAQWVIGPANPLTSRVIVNRVWQWHFGAGLSASPSDFGVMGSEPTNPELLDWLAQWLIDERWSLKKLHRLLVMSATYQTASSPYDAGWTPAETTAARAAWETSLAVDPDNELLWHRRRLRLEGETLRDAMLAASGQLSSRRGGPGVRPPLPPEITTTLLKDQWQVSGDEEDHRRRSIYLFVRRNLRFPIFDVFDRPDMNASCAVRHESTTATQSLVLLNSQFSLQCAEQISQAIARSEPDNQRRQVAAAYLALLSRPASADEIRLGKEFLDRQAMQLREAHKAAVEPASNSAGSPIASARQRALVDLCLALMNASEFLYVD